MSVPGTFLPPSELARLFADAPAVYMAGVGGIGMYSIARLLLCRGVEIIGYDRVSNDHTDDLICRGATVTTADTLPDISGATVMIYTSALSHDSPEWLHGASAGLVPVSRGDALGYITSGIHPSVAVCGMHGKSTTVSMLSSVWQAAGQEPTVICGAAMSDSGSPLRTGAGGVIYEACEYMRSFLSMYPDTAVLLNIDDDHTDCYPTEDSAVSAFSDFLSHSTTAVVNADSITALAALRGYSGRVVTYSMYSTAADIYPVGLTRYGGGYSFTLMHRGTELTSVTTRLPGEFNVSNALAAAAAAIAHSIPPTAVSEGLSLCRGCRRRLEYRGCYRGVAYYDDYAHHPAEVSASLAALRPLTGGRLICVFEGHTYSRVRDHMAALAAALSIADRVIVAPIYPAREQPIPGVTPFALSMLVGQGSSAYLYDRDILAALQSFSRPGDTVVIMGAGTIHRLFDHIPLLP